MDDNNKQQEPQANLPALPGAREVTLYQPDQDKMADAAPDGSTAQANADHSAPDNGRPADQAQAAQAAPTSIASPRKPRNFFMLAGLGLGALSLVLTAGMAAALQFGSPAISANLGYKPSFTIVQSNRPVNADVLQVENNTPFDLDLEQSDKPLLLLEGDAATLEKVSTRIEGSVLKIEAPDQMHNAHMRRILLRLPHLQQLTQRGSGDISLHGNGDSLTLDSQGHGDIRLQGQYRSLSLKQSGNGDVNLALGKSEKLELQLNGNGSLDVQGSTQHLHTILNGNGDLNAEHMAADTVEAQHAGNGELSLHARQNLTLVMSGNGDVHISGKPAQRNITVKGTGEVNFD